MGAALEGGYDVVHIPLLGQSHLGGGGEILVHALEVEHVPLHRSSPAGGLPLAIGNGVQPPLDDVDVLGLQGLGAVDQDEYGGGHDHQGPEPEQGADDDPHDKLHALSPGDEVHKKGSHQRGDGGQDQHEGGHGLAEFVVVLHVVDHQLGGKDGLAILAVLVCHGVFLLYRV